MVTPGSKLTRAKKSLWHFAVGRGASAIVGVLTMLLMVRVLNREDYGIYIALTAGFEILQLLSSPGAYAVVFRYVPEAHAAGAVHVLARLVKQTVLYRISTLAIVAVLVALTARPLSDVMGIEQHTTAIRIYALVLAFEGFARFVDCHFESTLMQGYAQISVLARNGAKLLALVIVGRFGERTVAIEDWLYFETATSFLGVVVSCMLLRPLIRPVGADQQRSENGVGIGRMTRFAFPTFVAQIFYMGSGAEMVKLLLTRLLGPAATATFGFAAVLSATVLKYLPSFLLVGWIRPLFIGAKTNGRSGDELVQLSSLVIKLNLLFIAPLAAAVTIGGDVIVDVLSGGRLSDAAPFLNFFMALLVLQTWRAVVSLLGVTYEIGVGSLLASIGSLIGLAAGGLMFNILGIWSMCLGLALSELLWIAVMTFLLHRQGVRFRLPWRAFGKFATSVIVPVLAAAYLLDATAPASWRLMGAALAALASVGLLAYLRPFEASERELINKLLPRPIFMF